MSLLGLKQYLMSKEMSSLLMLSQHFQTDPDLVRDMLQHWIRKGAVKLLSKMPQCSSCASCNPLVTECYKWIA